MRYCAPGASQTGSRARRALGSDPHRPGPTRAPRCQVWPGVLRLEQGKERKGRKRQMAFSPLQRGARVEARRATEPAEE